MACTGVSFRTLVGQQVDLSTSQFMVSVITARFVSKPLTAYRSTEPARVNHNVPIPPPSTPDTTNARARQGQSPPVNVPIGNNAALYCPTTGEELPTTMWLRGGNLVVARPPRITINNTVLLQGNISTLVLTINNVVAGDLGVYECRTRNRAGTDVGRVILQGRLCMQ